MVKVNIFINIPSIKKNGNLEVSARLFHSLNEMSIFGIWCGTPGSGPNMKKFQQIPSHFYLVVRKMNVYRVT